MSARTLNPDLGFVKDVISSGGESLKKCYQCATCSVVCNMTPDANPFPRKEMIQAQWGLKEQLFGNPDIWLCHQCSDCTAYCPRGAKPGEVLNAIRKMSIRRYSKPGFLAKMAGDPKSLIVLLAIPVVILLAILGSLGHLTSISNIPRGEDGSIVYAKWIPVPFIDATFGTAAAFALAVFIMGVRSYWKDLSSGLTPQQIAAKGGPFQNLAPVLSDILAHRKFEKCETTKDRAQAHKFVFYAFVGLAITTTWAILYLYGYELLGIKAFGPFHFGESPYPLTDPMKWLANVSALALIAGILMVISNRIKNKEKAGGGSYYDWLFILVVAGVAFTGFFSEIFRLINAAPVAYPTYFTHLVLVFFLFAYAPFSKMAHMVYRGTAMVYGKLSGRA
ncbi:MAG: quinone-interacting membrane-bound oxidoreductase complex subunit QmoC [Nitrospiraceae bacterium]|nr:quinone-interacting membrane-bound oxidoreductase complex subunit QmoC [Nitrospiraceae bacterium]